MKHDASALDPLVCALFLIIAFVVAGLAHSAWLRSSASRRFSIPLDGGLHVRGHRVFGANKTVRGFLIMVPAAAVSFAALAEAARWATPALAEGLWSLSTIQMAALGAWAALGFMLGELPNSFAKRQLDIAPGAAPTSRIGTVIGFLIDRYDSILGMLGAVTVAAGLPWVAWLWVIILGPAVHWSFSLLLYRLGVKTRAA